MDNESKFWLAIVSLFSFVLVVFILSIASYKNEHDSKIQQLILEGHNPVAVSCALDQPSAPVCLILASKLSIGDVE